METILWYSQRKILVNREGNEWQQSKKATLEDAWAIIRELGKAQKETDRQLKESQQELRESQKETDKQLKETSRQQKETDRQLKETDRQLKETSRQRKETDKALQSLSEDIKKRGREFQFQQQVGVPSLNPLSKEI